MKNIFLIFVGVLVTAIIVGVFHVIQGLLLDDWSGVHPYNRIFQVPLVVVVGFFLGLCILAIIRLFKMNALGKKGSYFKLGLILGLVGIGSLINPWVGYKYTDYLSILFVFMVSLSVAIRFSKNNVE